VAGIYLHIPFCKQRCTYCDFHFSTNFEKYRNDLILSMCKELVLRNKEVSEEVDTIYFGGGTPSLLQKNEFTLLLDTVFTNFTVNPHAEITIEVNPDDCSETKLKDWIDLGINRLSIGLQSFKEGDLNWMNRSHNSRQGIDAVKNARRAGFKNISIDLMYGLPNLSKEEWLINLKSAVALKPTHISAYCLTIEPKTAVHSWVLNEKSIPLNEDYQNEQFLDMIEFLSEVGYEQYEISNFAKGSVYAKHNTAYWEGKPYLGVGPSAHSYDKKSRRWNISNNALYVKNVGINECWYENEHLNFNDKWNELFLTGLRTKWGVNKAKINSLGGLNSGELKLIENYTKNGSLIENNTALILTQQGKLYADGIASSFFRVIKNISN